MRIWIELSGYLASALVFLTFYMKTIIPLRVVAILSNVAFMTYGLGGHLYPVFILHAILLPLNCLRLPQMRILIQKVRAASQGELSMEWLVPMMRRRQCAKGDVLFRRGDPAKELYVVFSGSLRLELRSSSALAPCSERSASSRRHTSGWTRRSAKQRSISA